MALLGALGTDAIGFWPRLAYWLIVMETGALIGIGVSTAVHAWGRLAAQPLIEGALIALAIAIPLSFIVMSVTALFFGMPTPRVVELLALIGIVFVVSCCMTAINYLVTGRGSRRTTVAASNDAAPDTVTSAAPDTAAATTDDRGKVELARDAALARFAERLPPPHRHARLLALEAEDHYLRVHTDLGSALVLMRLSDAVAELDGVPGAQTHRSWWVARDAVTAIDRGDGRAELTLGNAVTAPVSRSYYRSLRQSGWLET